MVRKLWQIGVTFHFDALKLILVAIEQLVAPFWSPLEGDFIV